MSNTIINQQLILLEQWAADAHQVGDFVADEVIDSLQRELNDATEDGLIWDSADSIKQMLSLEAMSAFDDACEKWITQRFDQLTAAVKHELASDWGFDTSSASLANLSKSFRIRENLEGIFDSIFAKSKPGVLKILTRVIRDELDDTLEHMDKEMHEDAERLKASFVNSRNGIAVVISNTASGLFLKTLHRYRDALMLVKQTA